MNNGEIQVKTEPEDTGYEASTTAASTPSNGDQEESNTGSSDTVYPSADSSQRLRGILTSMVNETNKELSVKSVIEDLLQRNDFLLAQNNAGLYKPQQRNYLQYKKYDDIVKAKYASLGNKNNNEGAILRPGSPTLACETPTTKEAKNQTIMEVSVLDDQAEEFLEAMDHEIVCGVASKAFVMTNEGVNIQSDLQFYWCNFCPFKTESKETLLSHVMEHRFHCKTCSYQSFSRGDVIRHAVRAHSDFLETAQTLKYCTFSPDYTLVQENTKKRKANDDQADTEQNKPKKAKVKQKPMPKSKKLKQKDDTDSQDDAAEAEPEKGKGKKDKDVDYVFDMEVDEVDEENDDDEEESTDKIIVPRSRRKDASTPGKNKTPSTPSATTSASVLKGVLGQKPTPPSVTRPQITSNITATMNAGNTKAGTPSSTPGRSGNTVTVSSGLCWNCGYCDFVTLSQTFLKTHLNTQHTGKAHKYVAMLVSSQEEMAKIKEKDALIYQNPNPTYLYGNVSQNSSFNVNNITKTPPTPVSQTFKPIGAKPDSTTDHAAMSVAANADDSESDEDYIPEVDKKKYPLTYKCAHCNFNAPVCFKIKEHLQLKHNGCVLYSLDMRAVKLKQRRYVFFCHRKNCSFTTKKTDEYLIHSESCTPWLDPACPEKIDVATKKCLELTRNFSSKISQKAFQMAKNFKATKTAEYACVHCSYTSNNNTRVKKHVLANHKDNETVMRDLQAHRMKKKMYVYFCKHCLWETRNDNELMDHLKEKHDDMSVVTPVIMPEAPEETAAREESMTPTTPANSTDNPDDAEENANDTAAETDQEAEYNSSPNSPADNTPAESTNNSAEEDDNFDELEVPEDIIQQLMDQYVTDEASRGGTSPGRPTRNAAAKAQIRCRAQGHSPQLFRCIHCHHMSFGVNLIRKHLKDKHKLEPMRAIDLKKKMQRQYAYFNFCPKDGCTFLSTNEDAVIKHAVDEHKFEKDSDELQRLTQPTLTTASPSKSASTGSQFECLYCPTNVTMSKMERMRRHIMEVHPTEEIIFRDQHARKLRKTSRVFMCFDVTCSYNSTDQKEYTLHKLAHEKSHIYECARCQWFTANPDTVGSHMSAAHQGEQVTTMEIYLDLDEKGNVVKKVGGTVIKQEPE